jgi:chromosomal replication initiator protein
MQQFFRFPISPACSFENFVPCDGNAGALEFARRIASDADSENLLYLHGPSGSGKTHLLKAIARQIGGAGDVPYLTCSEPLSADLLNTRFLAAPALIVDDLHLLPDDSAMRNALWQIFNDFHSSGRKIAMAGLVPPRSLPHLDDHLVSRLLWGLVARVDVSDDHSRQMILRKVAADRQVRIPDDVIDFILVTTGREAGELIAAFDRIYELSMASKRRITLPLAREAREQLQATGQIP